MVVDSRNTISIIVSRCSGFATMVIKVPGRFFFICTAE